MVPINGLLKQLPSLYAMQIFLLGLRKGTRRYNLKLPNTGTKYLRNLIIILQMYADSHSTLLVTNILKYSPLNRTKAPGRHYLFILWFGDMGHKGYQSLERHRDIWRPDELFWCPRSFTIWRWWSLPAHPSPSPALSLPPPVPGWVSSLFSVPPLDLEYLLFVHYQYLLFISVCVALAHNTLMKDVLIFIITQTWRCYLGHPINIYKINWRMSEWTTNYFKQMLI